ncbi:Regulator of V-ATPase in vacuolar membrane protein 1 [Podosphaera aphanis]|nr:Regulator of V-ATPase in vacuolar membrane protein 1 [Podosphaera aphanis]
MQTVLPGKPVPVTQAICTGNWNRSRFVAYITGSSLVILTGSFSLIQAIYDESGEQLKAIAFDETNGKIAASTEHNIRVYKPYGQEDEDPKWCLQNSIALDKPSTDKSPNYLSWGISEELLVSHTYLELYATLNVPRIIWKSKLANYVRFAEFSYDSAFIASAGSYDRFVKIWRRLSFGSDDTRFDYSYLPHPATVTKIRWRKPYDLHHTIDNVLYTSCADHILRIWVAVDSHDHSVEYFQLWGQIDLTESIKPRTLSNYSDIRYMFIIDGRDFMQAMEQAVEVKRTETNSEDHALTHLIEVANRSPEICIILDDLGHMSAWGLESISHKTVQEKNVFNIAHVDGLNLGLPGSCELKSSQIQGYNYFDRNYGGLIILIHHFDGRIGVFEGNLAGLFDPSPRSGRLIPKVTLTGHSERIKTIYRDLNGLVAVSQTECNENIVWERTNKQMGPCISRKCSFIEQTQSQGMCTISTGEYVISLLQDQISLWDARNSEGKQISACSHILDDKPLCVSILLEKEDEAVAYIATISSKLKGTVWKVQLPLRNKYSGDLSSITEFCSFHLVDGFQKVKKIITINSAGPTREKYNPVNNFNRDVLISYTHSGVVQFWAAKLDLTLKAVKWVQTCSVDTGICDLTLASGNTSRKIAILSSKKTELTIWDVQGNLLEYCQNFESQDVIQHLNWTSTPTGQSILAVGFPFRVLILAQMPYNYLHDFPSWIFVREFNIRDMTPHPIGDLAWISTGTLLIGAGNQLLTLDEVVDFSSPVVLDLHLPQHSKDWDSFKVINVLNWPLPAYHPQFLLQATIARKNTLVQRVIMQLYRTLKYFVERDSIDNLLGLDPQSFYMTHDNESTATAIKASENLSYLSSESAEIEIVTEEVASIINEKLSKVSLPGLLELDQEYLRDFVQVVAAVNNQKRSIDENAALYIQFLHLNTLRRDKKNRVTLSWREFNWAYYSESQDILLSMVSRQYNGKVLWENARESGIFMWIKDPTALKAHFEIVARNEYTKTDLKNPIDCTLFYLALRKKTVLQGLWRMAAWNREQTATMRLLANNFDEKKWKTAAMKNAYALLGKHRYEYAAAFFLLADCLKDAVNVILNQVKDLQLAIAVARVYEGDQGSVFLGLVEEAVIPLASKNDDKWLASWAFSILNKRDISIRALISPVYTLLDATQVTSFQARSFLKNDPALLYLYSQLREKVSSHSRCLNSRKEWELVLHYARLYRRMGCDFLALNLIHNWRFLPISSEATSASGLELSISSAKKHSGIKERLASYELLSEKSVIGQQKTSVAFEEPKSSSILDSFGF